MSFSKKNVCHTYGIKSLRYANEEVFKRVMDRVDYVMPDLKLVDDVQHKTTKQPIEKAPIQSL